uniref:Uncharacterized protein n=1 Tax=Timema tahoe TaxID=61484 RepID=A0A7R9ITD0_9NEOP|nr:unnamed protein product [Timema tahoe]
MPKRKCVTTIPRRILLTMSVTMLMKVMATVLDLFPRWHQAQMRMT